MVYVVTIFFSISLSWLTGFLWADYVAFALGAELISVLQSNPTTDALIGISYLALSAMVAILAVGPSLEARDFKSGMINAGVLGLMVGAVVASVARLQLPQLGWAVTAQHVVLAPLFTTTLTAVVYSVADLLVNSRLPKLEEAEEPMKLLEFSEPVEVSAVPQPDYDMAA